MKFATENIAHIADEYVLGLLSETDVAEVENEIERNAVRLSYLIATTIKSFPLHSPFPALSWGVKG